MLPEEVLEKYYLAGKIAAKVREEMKGIIREDMLIIDICEKAEDLIKSLGGKPAFPCNVSINEIAAHYTSPLGDKRSVPENSVVKIDIGVHIDGYIADTAATVCFNPEYEDLVYTAEAALRKAISLIRPGFSISQLGSEIQRVINEKGFKPISNLTGHQIGRYLIHAGKTLPNVAHFSTAKIDLEEIYAIEPFVTLTDAVGRVGNRPETYIFRLVKRKSLKHPESKHLLKYIETNFRTLPFAERWLYRYTSKSRNDEAFLELLSSKSLMAYPVFVEESEKVVAQAEHTILVEKEGARVLT